MTRLPASFLVLFALTGLAEAANPKVGDAAPELGDANWVMNPPEVDSIEKLKGEVVFVEKWGVKCGPCVAMIPHIQKLHEQFGARGLHVFAFEAQGHGADEIKATVQKRGGKTYSVSQGGGSAYQGDGGIPVAWLIGVEGKVIWQGNPAAMGGKLDKLIADEVAKVKYPGLGKTEFNKEVLPAVRAFLQGDLGKARADAARVAENDKTSEQARADAKYLLDKVSEVAGKRLARAAALEEEKRYLEALQLYAQLAGTFRKGEEGDKARERLKALRTDKEVKREMAAARELARLRASLEGKSAEAKKAALEKFAKSKAFQGTKAAAEAAAN